MRFAALITLWLAGFTVCGQDIPLFSQQLTNSFIYNPAMAGLTKGSLTFSHRNNYAGVEGAPRNNFLSFHAPISNYRFGFGVNMYQEDVAALKTTYISSAFAYHIDFNRFSTLSFGVSGEYNTFRLSESLINQNINNDLILSQYANGVSEPDFSFGINYRNRLWNIGVAANRLNTAWFQEEPSKALLSYYSAFVQGIIPLEGARSVLEPYVAYRQFSETSQVLDVGLYYTYDNKLITGVATRSGNILSTTLGFRFNKNWMVGYSREIILGANRGYTGSSNEFVLRLDFNDKAGKQNFRSDYKNAIAYRKKSITQVGITSRYNSVASRNPKQAHKMQKRLSPYSPNKRYQDMRKLSSGKTINQRPQAARSKASPNPKPSPRQKAQMQKKYKMKHSAIKKHKKSRQSSAVPKKFKGSGFKNNQYNPVRKKRP